MNGFFSLYGAVAGWVIAVMDLEERSTNEGVEGCGGFDIEWIRGCHRYMQFRNQWVRKPSWRNQSTRSCSRTTGAVTEHLQFGVIAQR